MNVLVLYQSRNGHTRAAAEGVAQAARALNHSVILKSVIEARKTDVEAADVLFVGTWVQGFILFGVKPTEAKLWVPALPSLEGKPVGVFCTYAFNPRSSLRDLGLMLAQRGAILAGQHAFQRSHPTEGVEPFVRGVLQTAERVPV